MKPTALQYARLLESASETEADTSAAAEAYAGKFLRFLKRRKEWRKRGSILAAFSRLSDRKAGVVRVTVTSAGPFGESDRQAVARATEMIFAPEKPVLTYRTDPSVIGGLSLRSEGILYDATVARRLRDLRRILLAH